jgi:LemA protein
MRVLTALGIVFGVLFLIGMTVFGWITGSYNTLVAQRMECSTQWSQVETQYQRRLDLIPNLVAATRGYLIHEEKVFKDIADARAHYANSTGDDKIKAQGELEGVLSRLMMIVENYPNLKADQTVKDLMFELSGTENRINVARQRYNEAVQVYNTNIQSFPSNIIAGYFHFAEKTLYVSQKGAEAAPIVNLEVQ